MLSRLPLIRHRQASECLKYLEGGELSRSYFETHGFGCPGTHKYLSLTQHAVVLCSSKESLGLKVPPESFGIDDVVEAVGYERLHVAYLLTQIHRKHFPLSVIDVATQLSLPHWTLGDWGKYYG